MCALARAQNGEIVRMRKPFSTLLVSQIFIKINNVRYS